MKKSLLVAGAFVLPFSVVASADVLALLANQADQDEPAPVAETTSVGPWYVAAAVGGTFALDSDAKDGDTTFKFKTGVGVNLGVGYALSKSWAIEVRSGILWNEIDGVNGSIPSLAGNSFDLGGGSGRIYQVPVMASAIYSFPVSTSFTIGIKAGVGIQWTDIQADSITVSGMGAPTSTFGYDNRSTAFRWELGVQTVHQIAPNVRIGGGVIFSGTSEVDLGSPTYAGAPAFLPSRETKLDGLYNVSLGFGINIAF